MTVVRSAFDVSFYDAVVKRRARLTWMQPASRSGEGEGSRRRAPTTMAVGPGLHRIGYDGPVKVAHLVSLLATASLLGCPPDEKKAPAPARVTANACEKLGQSCEYSPGKLGTCVENDDCPSGRCFVCQSQH